MSVFVCKRHFWWRHIWRHLHVTILKYWDKFSNLLIQWSISMILAKNYKTVTKCVKVMPRTLWPLFFSDTVFSRTRCIYEVNISPDNRGSGHWYTCTSAECSAWRKDIMNCVEVCWWRYFWIFKEILHSSTEYPRATALTESEATTIIPRIQLWSMRMSTAYRTVKFQCYCARWE